MSSAGPSSAASASKSSRARADYRSEAELHTIPKNATVLSVPLNHDGATPVNLMANFIQVRPMKDSAVYQYRVEISPDTESVFLRKKLFHAAAQSILAGSRPIFDGSHDARSGVLTKDEVTSKLVADPANAGQQYTVSLRRVGQVTPGSAEMIRLYNLHMKGFLRSLNFFQISSAGAYVHPDLATPIGSNNSLVTVRGYRTAANLHEADKILMNLESVHKIMQRNNVLETMIEVRRAAQGDWKAAVDAALAGSLVVTSYNKIVYKVEKVDFDMSPRSTFDDRKSGKQISYMSYYQNRYNIKIADEKQPLLQVTQNNRRRRDTSDKDDKDIYIVPELCNIAGLTQAQRLDNRLKIDLIKANQIPPADRVSHIMTFLQLFHSTEEIKKNLQCWGYEYAPEPVKLRGRLLKSEPIGVGKFAREHFSKWPKIDNQGGFEREVMRESLAVAPPFPKMVIIIPRREANNEGPILGKLKGGFERIGLQVSKVEVVRINDDTSKTYVQTIRNLGSDVSAALIIMSNQNKEKYEAIKKLCTVEKGLITQVVTSRLMMDDRKASGAAVKIGIQIAAKVGGEPWHIYLPLEAVMICGYDTYHDTASKGRSFGAFVASLNSKFSKWFSKADNHDSVEELSTHMSENLNMAIKSYREINNRLPERILIYRDGVGDGQLNHVFNVELEQIKNTLAAIDKTIKLSFIVVNKRVGARFYLSQNNSFVNPMPGTVVDDVVTRKQRFDFYLISQSTRHGTVAPTYYIILYDESNLGPARQQAMAFKLTLMYFNWAGTVRVPAPCQYAHKLALICGEHLHAVPNAKLDNKLHFL